MRSYFVTCDLVAGIVLVCGGGSCRNMPSDIVSFAVSTGLGVSVLAGILSGVCYLLTQKAQGPKRSRKTGRQWYCGICGTYLRSIDGILEGDKVVTCAKCQSRICKTRCSKLSEQTEWVCRNCLNTPESWYQGILSALQLYKTVDLPDTMNKASLTELDEDIEALRKKEKERIRDFIEQLVNTLIGGNVDDASVSKIYNDRQYLPVQGQTPCTPHAALKQLIQRLIQESFTLPLLQKAQDHPAKPNEETNRTYEELLATAIINKVVSDTQNRHPNSSAASVSSRISSSSRRDDKEYFFGQETLDNKWKTTDLESTSLSSVEDWLHSESSFGSKKYVDRETLTIKHDIEVTESDSEEDNDNEYFQSRTSLLGDDEPNWFLQKRHFQTASPVPVPMLVPKPTTEAKVLIGDKEIDETSDLSDIASDYEETDIVPGTQNILVESKTIIGGKNPLHTGSDGESSADSGVKEVERDRCGYDEPDFVTKTDITVDDDNVEDTSILSVYSNTEKEAEYTERYASLPRTILKTPTPPSRPSLIKGKQNGDKNLETSVDKPKIDVHINEETPSSNAKENAENGDVEEDTDPVFEGSYSKKEKEKWKHAVEMKNNPYSRENIEKRFRRTKSPFETLYGPDYYAKQASMPSGGKNRSNEGKPPEWSRFGKNIEDDEKDSWVMVDPVPPPLPKVKPPKIDEMGVDYIFDTHPSNTDSTSEFITAEATSDSDASFINYYDVKNSEVHKKHKDNIANDDTKVNVRSKPFEQQKPPINTRYNKNGSQSLVRRLKSESDLVTEDSFDAPPKVLNRKRDNTLISKIYSNPQVRNFALSARKEAPKDKTSSDVFTTGTYENTRYNGNVPVYNSEGEISDARRSFTGDLLETTGKRQYNRSSSSISHYGRRTNSVSSEEDILSENSTETKLKSKNHIYSSTDDLFSIEEQDKPQKKKDNTLIDKIYQNPQVRNYALANRDNMPVQGEEKTLKKAYNSDDETMEVKMNSVPNETFVTQPILSPSKLFKALEENKSDVNPSSYGKNYGLHFMSEMEGSDDIYQKELAVVIADANGTSKEMDEIEEISKKKIVHHFLDVYEKSNPSASPRKKLIAEKDFSDSDYESNVSVKELRKKFEHNNVRKEVKSSLTARSLSKKVREELKQ